MDDIGIRAAAARDVPLMLPILREVADLHHRLRPDIFKESPRHHTDEDALRNAIEQGAAHAIVAEAGGRILGALLYRVRIVEDHPSMKDAKTLWVDDLCVKDGHRGKGIGTALMNAAMDELARNGLSRLELNVWAANEGAVRFYTRYGMRMQRTVFEIF